MKYLTLITLSLCFLTNFASAKIVTLDFPVEIKKIKAEFYEVSGKGKITLVGCSTCDQTVYEFETPPDIYKGKTKVTYQQFMQEYWTAKHPTVFLNLEKTQILRIKY